LSTTSRKQAEIVAPPYLSRGEKRAYRCIFREVSAREGAVSGYQRDLIADLVEARSRIQTLNEFLASEVAYSDKQGVVRGNLVQLMNKIEASTKLAHRIAEKLGAN